MILLKKTARYFLYSLLTLVLLISFYLFCAWFLPFLPARIFHTGEKEEITVFVRSNGVHTDLILPVRSEQLDWSAFLPYSDFEKADFTHNYIALGWGDKGFYLDTKTWDDLKISTAFKAAFGMGGTAMHVSYQYKPRESKSCKAIQLSKNQYSRLCAYVVSSFRIRQQRPVAIAHPGYSDLDCFYEGSGVYSLFKTCNVWTGNALDYAGYHVGYWTPLDSGVMNSLE